MSTIHDKEPAVVVPDDKALSEEEADAQAAAIAVPEDTGEGGKLKMIVSLVKKCFGVKDIASMRLSLPASLLEPVPNLEYWHYLDRPDLFAAINDSSESFERMLATIRFTLSKDLRHIRGKPVKPYNSVLGEHFRAHWDVPPVSYSSNPSQPPILHVHTTNTSSGETLPGPENHLHASSEVRLSSTPASPVAPARKSGFGGLLSMKGWSTPALDERTTSPVESIPSAQFSNLSLASAHTSISTPSSAQHDAIRIAFLTEQVSHHPPVSAYVASCPARHITLSGIDQIAAKVTSTASIRVGPGSFNKGLMVEIGRGAEGETVNGAGERYNISHPAAHVNGLLRGNPWISMGESTIVTCEGGEGECLRAVIEYKEESWLGRAQFAIEGVVHSYTPGEDAVEEWTKVKHVPRERVLAEVDGSWRGAVRWRKVSLPNASTSRLSTASGSSSAPTGEWNQLIDLATLYVVPKTVRPLEKQLPNESRRLWDAVTARLTRKEFGEATKAKVAIEQKQRDDAAARKSKGVEFVPAYFETDISSGKPTLTEEGRKALEEELKDMEAEAKTEAEAPDTPAATTIEVAAA
ncbi:hypothetical protein OF83DRAFT_1114044 [Amylostereum chailletii]|nr:hypothetical protein OF83DRAFT_1114044 [Amylostereum chailletii]